MDCLLINTSKLCVSAIKCHSYHTSGFLNGWRQTGNAMKKVLGANRKRKLYFEDRPKMPSADLFSSGCFEGKRVVNSKRAKVLNKLFMRHITDQLGTGKCAPEVLGYGIEINRVQITPDCKILRIYWLAKGNADDDIVEKILQKNSGLLRHELSQLRLMGVVPTIQFVKDKHYAHIAELDNRLAIADFGEEHVPLDPAEKFKTEFAVLSPLDDTIKEQLKQMEKNEKEEYKDLPLPPMPQNVLGLNHADILERIKKSKKKSEALHRLNPSREGTEESWVTFKLQQPRNENPIELGSEHSQRAAFKEFLQKRQLLRMKAKQENKNYLPDLEYIREELRNRHLESLSKFDLPEIPQEDFIEEDSEDPK